jgi:hypothetical protein
LEFFSRSKFKSSKISLLFKHFPGQRPTVNGHLFPCSKFKSSKVSPLFKHFPRSTANCQQSSVSLFKVQKFKSQPEIEELSVNGQLSTVICFLVQSSKVSPLVKHFPRSTANCQQSSVSLFKVQKFKSPPEIEELSVNGQRPTVNDQQPPSLHQRPPFLILNF